MLRDPPGCGAPRADPGSLRDDERVTFLRVTRQLTVAGPRNPGDVWDRYVRPERWPEWSPQIRTVGYPHELLTPATTGVVHGPAGVRVPFRIDDVDGSGPERAWSWTVAAAGLRLVLRHTVRADGAGTRTGLSVTGPAPVVLLYLPVAGIALRRLVSD